MGGRESRLNCSRIYLKKFSCDQRENMAPATWIKGICGWVVDDHLATVGDGANLADRDPLRSTIGSARSTVVVLKAGPWISTSRVRKSSCGQSSPLKFGQVMHDTAPGQTLEQVRAPALDRTPG